MELFKFVKMRKTIFATLTALLALSSSAYAQEEKVNYIKFEYSVSIRVYSEIEIYIGRSFQNPLNLEATAKFYKRGKLVEKAIPISQAQLDELITEFKKITSAELIEFFRNGLDGSSSSLTLGNIFDGNSIKYSFWGFDPKNQDLNQLTKTIQMMMKTVDIPVLELD